MNKSTVVDLALVPVHTGSAQHIGKRENQQDAWGFSSLSDATFARHGGCLGVLADGMGGMEQGVWASAQAVKEMIAHYQQKPPGEAIPAALKRSLTEANRTVYQQAKRWHLIGKMGTTLVAAVIHDRSLHWISTGDSRVYLISEQAGIKQLTTDHNYQRVLQLKIERGEITSEEAKAHPFRNGLTSFVGDEEIETIDQSGQGILIDPGSWVLLCSDGLSGVLSDAEILEAFRGRSPQGICRHLIDEVTKRNLANQDNVSIVVMRVPVSGEVQQVSAIRGPVVPVPRYRESYTEAAPTKMVTLQQLLGKIKKMNAPSRRILISIGALCLLFAVLMFFWAFLQSNGVNDSAIAELPTATPASGAVTIQIQPTVEEPPLSPNLGAISVPSSDEQKAEAERIKNAAIEAQATPVANARQPKRTEVSAAAAKASTIKKAGDKTKPPGSPDSTRDKPKAPSGDGSGELDLAN